MGMHVVPSRKCWRVIRAGAKRVLRKFNAYGEAYDYAIDSVKPDEYIYLHGKCGRISERFKGAKSP